MLTDLNRRPPLHVGAVLSGRPARIGTACLPATRELPGSLLPSSEDLAICALSLCARNACRNLSFREGWC